MMSYLVPNLGDGRQEQDLPFLLLIVRLSIRISRQILVLRHVTPEEDVSELVALLELEVDELHGGHGVLDGVVALLAVLLDLLAEEHLI